jgi:hypothetical protein
MRKTVVAAVVAVQRSVLQLVVGGAPSAQEAVFIAGNKALVAMVSASSQSVEPL